jgi:amino acid adenylation domain-containing protein
MQTETIQGFRLSPQQKRTWLFQQGNNQFYQSKCALLIEGLLNIEVLKQAWHYVINRHEIIRTYFHCLPGMTIPLQVISNGNNFAWESVNINDADIEKFIQATDDNFYLSLARIAEQKHILLINLPALYADATSLQILAIEISRSYACLSVGTALDDEPMQYADFSEWQNELLESEDTETGRNYWFKQDLSTVLNIKLPLEKITESLKFEPKFISQTINSPQLAQIKALADKHQTSLSSLLLACWQVLIYRLTRQSNLVIGIAADGRKYTELETAIGLITKYLPIQSHLEANISFTELLQNTLISQQEVHQWQEYFSWEIYNLPDLSFLPVCFEFHQTHQKIALDNLSFSIIRQYTCIDRFKIKLVCTEQDNVCITEFHYDAGLFNESDIQRLSLQFHTLVTSIIETPNQAISQLEILSDKERQQILIEINNTQIDFPTLQAIHQRFEQQVEKTPNAIALVYENEQLTYQQLNQRANQLAHHLRKLGVVPEVLVAVYLERSLEMAIALLAILKAGGAYVPLDSTLPSERLALMLQDTQAKVIVTQQHLVKNLPASSTTVFCWESELQTIQQESDQNLECVAEPENLAYVIYTSGSTGTPKGVGVEHRQILNYLNGIWERLNLASGASFAMVSTFAADLGNTALFPALCTGGCLHLISYDRAADAEALGQYFQKHPIDCLKIVPSHLSALLASSQPELILPRQKLVLGGEVLSWALIDKIHNLNPSCGVLNHYGPTEATVGVLTYEVESNSSALISQTVPLGRPLANTQIYILDQHLQLMPIGVPGELYIGGNNLARGYLHQPELTAEKFIDHPEDGRLYKTGDLARYLPDGNIEILGRIDQQVKIRGFRIELREIEAVLEQHDAIQQALVMLREDVLGEKRLVSYIMTQVIALGANDLRDFLKAKLPEYMVPSTFVFLKNLPLTANGKVDREKLPVPEQVRPELLGIFVTPRNQTEEAIAQIWSEILGVEQVGIHDDFFELGGHSLLATQVISRLRQALQVELPLRQFFDSPTVADLAVMVAQNLAQQTDEAMLAEMLAELEAKEESQEVLVKEGADL